MVITVVRLVLALFHLPLNEHLFNQRLDFKDKNCLDVSVYKCSLFFLSIPISYFMQNKFRATTPSGMTIIDFD